MIQSAAGFFIYFIVMAHNGFLPQTLLGIRGDWDNTRINDLEDSYGQQWTYADRKLLEYTCSTAYFISIVQNQWVDLLICKTRRNSIFNHGMSNWRLNFSLVFATLLTCFFAYTPGMDVGFHMMPVK